MSHSKFITPKKKRRIKETRESPFPVPIATITHESSHASKWFYTGQLQGNHVVVKHSGDMEFLYKMGFFGKGTLSRSKPDYNRRQQIVNVPDTSGEITTAKVVNRRYYVRHLNLKNMKEGDVEKKYEEYDSTQESDNDENFREQEQEEAKSCGRIKKLEELSDNLAESSQDKKMEIIEDVLQCKNKTVDIDPWANTEADDSFWGSETLPSEEIKNAETEKSWDKSENEDFRSAEEVLGYALEKSKTDENLTCDKIENKEVLSNMKQERKFGDISEKYCDNEPEFVGIEGINNDNNELQKMKTKNTDNVLSNKECESVSEMDNQQNEVEEIDTELDPLCKEEGEMGELFVVEDTDSEDEGKRRKFRKQKWFPVLKSEPYPVKEMLHLSLEESFFLAYGLGCLNCLNEKHESMNLSQMWRVFNDRQKSFLPCYVVYHYFRSKGWVPKSGLKFGADFIIYKEGPPFYHGSYSVIVRMVDESTMKDDEKYKSHNFTWTSLSGLNRVTEHVAKELMLCFVIKPSDITDEDLDSPKCILRFKVQEILVSRWVSSQEREDKKSEEIP